MKNKYEAPDVFTMSNIDSFVLGGKPDFFLELDAILGWGWGFFPWFDDIDEDER